jgi:hypothetical protein
MAYKDAITPSVIYDKNQKEYCHCLYFLCVVTVSCMLNISKKCMYVFINLFFLQYIRYCKAESLT